MNSCEHAQLVHSYYDGELAPERVKFVESHLPQCEACQHELAALRQATTALRFGARPVLSAEALSQLHRRIDGQAQASAEKGAIRFAFRLTAAAAVVVIASLVQIFVGASSTGSTASAGSTPAWETTAMLAIADARGGSASDEYKLVQWMRDDLSGTSASQSGDRQ